jgi:hypothetical protein
MKLFVSGVPQSLPKHLHKGWQFCHTLIVHLCTIEKLQEVFGKITTLSQVVDTRNYGFYFLL